MPLRPSSVGALLLLGVLALSGRAEEEEAAAPALPFAVRDTNAARFAVREVRRLHAEGRTVEAMRVAQEILDTMPEDFYRLGADGASIRWRLAAEEARDLLAGLSAPEREVYDRFTRTSTGPLVERAVRLRDVETLGEVVDRFGASTAGVAAARLLADLALEDGASLDAAYWAQTGLRFAPRDVGLWLRYVDALGAARHAGSLASLAPPAGLAPAEDARKLADRIAHWMERLPPPAPPAGWPLWGGTPRRAAVAELPGPRPESLRWIRDVPLSPGLLDRDPFRGGLGDRETLFLAAFEHLRPFHPVVVGRTVYVSSGRSVAARDLFSGTALWVFDWERPDPLGLLQPGAPAYGRTSLERVFTPVVHGDLVFATVEVHYPYDRETLQGVEISTYLPRRVLVALDRRTGALRWHMADTPGLEEMTVVAPCVVDEDLAVVVAARNEGGYHHAFFLAFDAATGTPAWTRSVGWGNQELNLFGSAVKELAASAPALADGTAYASTGLGFVAAVDLRTGRPEWLASYEIQPIEAVEVWYEAPLRFPRVAPSPAVVHGDLLLVAPTDGKHLHAFERGDGRLRWRVPYPRSRVGAPAHFLGVASDGKREVALLTGTDLVAYDLADGERVWLGRLQDEYGEQNVPVGRGAVAGDHVLVPTTNGLVRFSLRREGSFEGRDPWPTRVAPGNLLPLDQVLLVTARESLQAFYSWAEIERDIDRRRRARPGDPLVLLEAGEIYRMGGALDRARGAFRDALELARRGAGDPEAERRAARGLYLTWVAAAERDALGSPAEARAALERALAWSRTPAERVEARVRLDQLLEALPEERVQNLVLLVEESAGVRARFPGEDAAVPARAMALFRLAQVYVDQGRPVEAVSTLQRLLRDEGDAMLGDVAARDHARRMIDEITRVWGDEPYREHQDRAVELLTTAEREDDADLLEQILREYPNASVVPAALLRLGARRLANGRADEAAQVLRRLLAEHPRREEAPAAGALLARAYGRSGLSGARAFALAWLEARHPDASFELDGERRTGRAYAEAERRPARLDLPPASDGLATPLREVHFEDVGEDAWGRQIEVATEPGVVAPLALLAESRSLVAFDLVRGRVGFRIHPGPCHRALYSDGVLLLALSRALRGVTADTGQTLWAMELEGSVIDLRGQHGVAYVLLHDTVNRRGERSLLALDTVRGRVIWRLELGGEADFRNLLPHGPDVLLREARLQGGHLRHAMLVIDGVSGRLRHVIGLPTESRTESEPVVVAEHLLVAARDASGTRHLSGHELATGELAWTLPLPGAGRVCAVVPDGRDVVVLQDDGSLGTYHGATGSPVTQTRIFVGDRARACPFHGTQVLVRTDEIVLMPRTSTAPFHIGAWDRRTGKLVWDVPLEGRRSPARSTLRAAGETILALTPYNPPRAPARVVLRLLDARAGTKRQEIEPVGLTADYGLLSLANGWGTVVVFGRAGAAVYAGGAERPAPEAGADPAPR